MHFKMMAAVPAMLFVGPAIAQTATDAAAPAPVKEKKVCRRDGPATGSILGGHTTCHTKSEWAAIDRANSESVDRARNAQSGGLGTSASGAR
jgi:hypothetical protein